MATQRGTYLSSCDACQGLPYRLRQRVAGGQEPFGPGNDAVEQRQCVAESAGGVIAAGQLRLAGEGGRVVGSDGALVALAGLLVELERRAHPARGVVRGGEAAAGLERVLVVGPERALAVGQNPLVLADGILGLASGQVGVGQAEAG